MPGNTVVINNALYWYVGDSKMEKLLKLLKEIGIKEEDADALLKAHDLTHKELEGEDG